MGFSSRFSTRLVVGLLFLVTLGGLCSNLSAQLGSFAGTWTGTWTSPFGSGSITLEVMISGNDVTAELTQTGTIFAIPGPHGPFTLTGTFDSGSGIVITDPDNSLYGPLTITIGLDGMGTASAPSVPGGLISSASGSGTLDEMNLTGSGSGTALFVGSGSVFSSFTLTLTTPAPPQLTTFYFPQIVEGVASIIKFTTQIILENTSSSAATVTVNFFSTPDGAPMLVELVGLSPASSFSFNLAAGETLFLQTTGTTDPLQVGYACVTAPSGVSGLAIFIREDDGITVSKSGVPASGTLSEFTLPIDTLGANNIGMALVNPPGSSPAGGSSPQATANLTARLYDNDFNLLATQTLTMAEGAHLPRFVTDADFFQGVMGIDETTGSVTIESDVALAVAVLLQDDDLAVGFPTDVPILTTFPALPGRADQ